MHSCIAVGMVFNRMNETTHIHIYRKGCIMIDKDHIIANLREVFDPEISINIYDLGLIYDIDIDQENKWVTVTHTLTSAFCSFADIIVQNISDAVYKNQEINHVEVITTFDPPFTMESVPETTKMMMGW